MKVFPLFWGESPARLSAQRSLASCPWVNLYQAQPENQLQSHWEIAIQSRIQLTHHPINGNQNPVENSQITLTKNRKSDDKVRTGSFST
jgi:hypothetical protein